VSIDFWMRGVTYAREIRESDAGKDLRGSLVHMHPIFSAVENYAYLFGYFIVRLSPSVTLLMKSIKIE